MQVLAIEAATDILVGAHAQEHGIVFLEQLVERLVPADACVEHELDAHAFEDLASFGDDLFLELEWRDAVGQQSTDVRVRVVHDRPDALSCQNVGRRQSCRPCANDADDLACVDNVLHVRPPALRERLVGDVLLDAADRDGLYAVIQRALALAKAILRTNSPANFR